MTPRPGSLFRVGGRPYVDSQAIYNLAQEHEVTPTRDGWRISVRGGSIRCAAVQGHAALPGQHGHLYALHVEGRPAEIAWFAQGLVREAGVHDTWPDEVKSGCTACGTSCGCDPCRRRRGDDSERSP